MKTLILNSADIVQGTSNAVFQYTFPSGGVEFYDDYVAVQQISMYYSNFNISTSLNNNRFSYTWVDGTVVNIVIPDSNMSIQQINQYLQFEMIAQNHYLISGGNNIYLLEMVVNQARYSVQVNSYLISVAIATANTWVLPSGATWVLPTNPILPYLTILPVLTSNFGSLIGYAPGQYPLGTITGVPPAQVQTPAYIVSQSFLSTLPPNINPQYSYLCLCSMVNNKTVIPSQLLYTLTPTNVEFGALINQQINDLAWNKISNGFYNSFTFSFRDQNGRPISFNDPNTIIILVVQNRNEFL
jgi:hypothetical protein